MSSFKTKRCLGCNSRVGEAIAHNTDRCAALRGQSAREIHDVSLKMPNIVELPASYPV